jgi:transcriptional regulator with XRE-family HTH domain
MTYDGKFGSRIRDYRLKLKLSTTELAEKIGVKQPNITQMENDQRQPDVDKVVKLARAFGITVDELIGNVTQVKYKEHNIIVKEVENATKKGVSEEQIASAIRFITDIKTQAD